jgi:hypothetical protein
VVGNHFSEPTFAQPGRNPGGPAMSETEIEALKNEILDALGGTLKKELNKSGNRRVGLLFLSIMGATAWFTVQLQTFKVAINRVSTLHQEAIRYYELAHWIEETTWMNMDWKPAPFLHKAEPLGLWSGW